MTVDPKNDNITDKDVAITMVDVLELARYLLYMNKIEADQAEDEAASDMSPMKLQKLLYYCQGYSLGLTGRLLFEDTIEAWEYGPVVQRVYKEYKEYKGQCLPLNMVESAPQVDDYTAGIARLVMRDKGKYSAITLMKMTHEEPAWRETRQRDADINYQIFAHEPISTETMKVFFMNELDDEMSPDEEDRLWKSAGREPTAQEWASIAEWASSGFSI